MTTSHVRERKGLRIGVNTFFLQHPNTGSGQYCARLLDALHQIDGDNSYHLIAPSQHALPSNWRPPACVVRSAPPGLNRQLAKVWFEQVAIPQVCARERIDLVHYPYFAAPLVCRARVVLTLHDLIPITLEPYRGSFAVRAYSFLVATAAKRAAGIIADSDFTRRDIVRVLKIPDHRIRVVHLAASENYTATIDRRFVEAVRLKYGLDADYVFYLGGLDVRKNVGRLIHAFATVKRQMGGDVKLAIAGKPMSNSLLFPRLTDVIEEEKLGDGVVFLGQVPEEDCPLLYNGARLFVYPSLYEGFGLPPLEAMACGTPVICSNTSSLPEVVGDAAITVDPTSVDALAEAIQRVLGNEGLQAELREKGLARARQFSWRKTAEQTLAAFEEFASAVRPP